MGAKRTFVTKKKLSGVRTEYRAWKEWDEGDILIGKLVGSSQNKKNKSKKDWIVEVLEMFFADKKEEKRLRGKTVTLNTAGQLDKGLEQLTEGKIFQVTYNGQKRMEGGDYAGQMAHTMEVEEVEEEGDKDTDLDDEEEEEEEEEENEEEEDL